jgi:hypothetical protein
MAVDYSEIFPRGIPIAADVFGNFWMVDLTPSSTDWAPIYFACHDAPIILYQSPSLEHFLTALLHADGTSEEDLIDGVHEDTLFEVWRENPGVLSQEECLRSADPELNAFARELDPSFQLIDMRNPAIGFGYSWGRYGPDTVVRRYGTIPLFAYRAP